jgi:hypothetical protein
MQLTGGGAGEPVKVLEGYLTLAITSLFWGTAGFAIGYAKDLRVAADDENIADYH